MRYQTILWDFDGTLVDTSPGIMDCIRYACAELDQPEPDEKTLRKFIGPPLYYSFQTYLGYPAALAEKATHVYREQYMGGGVYHSYLYPGMAELLKRLCDAGIQNAVTTLKPENTARLLLSHFDIAQYFAVCKGSDPSKLEDLTKGQIVQAVLEQMDVRDCSQAVLIGDTAFDEQGARENGLGFVAAAYGFGFLEKPDCLFYAESVEALGQFLL